MIFLQKDLVVLDGKAKTLKILGMKIDCDIDKLELLVNGVPILDDVTIEEIKLILESD